jgi:hypothetical protein
VHSSKTSRNSPSTPAAEAETNNLRLSLRV